MEFHNEKEIARALFEESNDALLLVDVDDLHIIDVNSTAQRFSGFKKKQLLEMRLTDLFGETEQGAIDKVIEALQGTRFFHSQDGYLLNRNQDESISVNVSVSRIHTDPNPLGLVAVRDVSERKWMEQVLWSLAGGTASVVGLDFFQRLAQSLAYAFSVRNVAIVEHIDSPVTRVRTLGYWVDGSIVENIEYDVVSTPCAETATGAMTFYAQDLPKHFPDDDLLVKLKIESYCGIPLNNPSGSPIGHIALLNDKAMPKNFCEMPLFSVFAARAAAELERRQMERRMQQLQTELARANRVASMGTMASALAHEIQQPLSVIANYAQACIRGFQNDQLDSKEVTEALREISAEAIRAGEVVRRIHGFVSRQPPKKSTVDINRLIQDVVRLVSIDPQCNDVDVTLDLMEKPPDIVVDRIQIQQVLMNLIRNAIEAVHEAGRKEGSVTIRTVAVTDKIVVNVTDTGIGISSEIFEKIFDPYFSTKFDGLGMGLSISRSIIDWHDGHLQAIANSDRGMTFQVMLPIPS